MDAIIELWGKMIEAEVEHEDHMINNVGMLRDTCRHARARPPPPARAASRALPAAAAGRKGRAVRAPCVRARRWTGC